MELMIEEIIDNPYYVYEIINNYNLFNAELNLFISLCRQYFIKLRDGVRAPTPTNIFYMHFIFRILYFFELNVDCNDPKNMDCIYLKNLIQLYKETGIYDAYLKYISGLQIQQQNYSALKKTAQMGGGNTSYIYILYILIGILETDARFEITYTGGRARPRCRRRRRGKKNYYSRKKRSLYKGGVKYDTLQAYDKQLSADFGTNPEKISAYFSKLVSLRNLYGSCVYQSLAVGNSSRAINNIIKTYVNNYDNTIIMTPRPQTMYVLSNSIMYNKHICFTGDLIINHYNESVKQFLIDESEYYIQCLRDFNNEKHLYHHRKHKVDYLEQQIITSDKEHRDFVIKSIGAQLHFTDLYKTLDPSAEYILTYLCSYKIHNFGHEFNVLYNTSNSKICIIDYEMLPDIIAYINLYSTISQYLGRAGIYPLMYSEPGFWKNTAFEQTNMFKLLNMYDSNPFLKYLSISNIALNDDTFYLCIETGKTAANLHNTKKDVTSNLSQTVFYPSSRRNFSHGLNDQHPFLNVTTPYVNLVSFGCATLNETEKSLEMLLTSYNTILHYKNIDNVFNVGAMATKLESFYISFIEYIKNRNQGAPEAISNVAQNNSTSKKKHKKSKSRRR